MPGPTPPESIQGDQPGSALFRQVWRRINVKNEHWMHCIVGREGSGKSLTSLKMAGLLDDTFSADNVVFKPAEFLRMLRDGAYERGDIYVIDEAGVGLGNRTWQESGQKKLNQALQLIRNHNIGVIFTLPRLGELDSQTQGRLHSYYEISGKEPDEYVIGRWRWLDPDRVDITGEIYRKKPRYDGKIIDSLKVTPPTDDELIEAYKERKEGFQEGVYDGAIDELDPEDADDGEQYDGPREIADAILANGGPEQYMREINNGTQVVLDSDRIAVDYKVGDPKAKKVKKVLLDEVDREGLL
jgi:hypothetical protein